MTTLEIKSPLTGETLKTYEKPSTGEVILAMQKAREAYSIWSSVPIQHRLKTLRKIRHHLLDNADKISTAISSITGKVKTEALLSEIFPVLEQIKYYENNAERILSPKKFSKSFSFPNSTFMMEYKPMGVIAIISPWNLPFQLSLIPTLSAITAGNAVIIKPSEVTLTSGEIILDIVKKSNLPENLIQILFGDGETGKQLIESGPDKILFTGRRETGQKIMETASKELIPLDLELGGKDPMVVFEDAHFDRASNGAIYGAFCNSGQVCASVERLYVHKNIHDKFLDSLVEKTKKIRVGYHPDCDIGAITFPQQIHTIEDHIQDALSKGAVALTEVRKRGPFFYPVILKNVNHSMKIMNEETFGPVLPVMSFYSEEEAIDYANRSHYGLNASIWTQDLKKGRRVASKIHAGNCAVNDVIKNIGNPEVPFGGVKKSGFGRYHGEEGLYTFSEKMSIMINTGKTQTEINWFPYNEELYQNLKSFAGFLHSKKNIFTRLKNSLGALKFFRKFVK